MKKTISGPATVEINGQHFKCIGDIHVEISDVEGILMDRQIERDVNLSVVAGLELRGHIPEWREMDILFRSPSENKSQNADDFDYMTARGWKLDLTTGRYHRP